MPPGLTLETLSIMLAGTELVRLDRHVAPGEVLTVMGPSGSGKSTLLAALLGTMAPDFDVRGRVWLDGRDLTGLAPEARRLGLLFQDDLLFPHLSVGGNLAFGLTRRLRGRKARRTRIAKALADVGLADYMHRDPATLSGGQRARVALARALLAEPGALMLDEPFSRLDAALRAHIRELVFGEIRARGLPAILVTHDIQDAEAAAGPIHHLTA